MKASTDHGLNIEIQSFLVVLTAIKAHIVKPSIIK